MVTLPAEAADIQVHTLGGHAFSLGDSGARGVRMGVVRQLLGDLDTATVAGVHFTMDKVVALLRVEIGSVEPELNDLERRVIQRALAELGRERERLLPNADLFVARTEMIADTLALI